MKPYQILWKICNNLTRDLGQLATGTGILYSQLGSWQPENWDFVQPWMTGTGTHHNAFRRLNSTLPRCDRYFNARFLLDRNTTDFDTF